MSKLWDELNRPLNSDEAEKVVSKILKVLFCIACVLMIICGSLGVYNRTINKAQAVNETHQDLVKTHDWRYCPYCEEALKEE